MGRAAVGPEPDHSAAPRYPGPRPAPFAENPRLSAQARSDSPLRICSAKPRCEISRFAPWYSVRKQSLCLPCYAKPSKESPSAGGSANRDTPPPALPPAMLAHVSPVVPLKCPAREPSPRNLAVPDRAQDTASPKVPRPVPLLIPTLPPTRPGTAIRRSFCRKIQTDSRTDSPSSSFPVELVWEMLQLFSL